MNPPGGSVHRDPPSAQRLQRLTRDLAALHAMPAVWKGQPPDQILAGFAGVLGSLLHADAVRIVVTDPETGLEIEHTWPRASDLASRLRAAVPADRRPDEGIAVALPGEGRPYRVCCLPTGAGAPGPHVLVASRREHFPAADERFILQAGLELATVALENARLLLHLRRSQELLDLANQSANVGVWECDLVSDAVRLDRRALLLTGRDPAGGEKLRWSDLVHPDDVDRLVGALTGAVADGSQLSEDVRIVRPDGEVRWLTLIGRAWSDPVALAPAGQRGIAIDTTQRRELEEHLRQVARMESVGLLAGGVAHETNNQMSVVLGTTSFLLRREDLAPEARQDIEQIRRAAERTAAVTLQLLAFSRRQVVSPRVVDLNVALAELEPVLRRTLADRGRLVVSFAPGAPCALIDPGQLEQLLLNLTLNARDALAESGRVEIRTDLLTLAEPLRLPDGPPIPPGCWTTLLVRDNGRGIEPEILGHIFEPFFTTKGVGQGTGLGLASVYGIVTQGQGRIVVSSRPGEGAAFTVYFPAVAGAVEAAPAAVGSELRGGGRMVLLAEDEPLVRAMTARILLHSGFRVMEAEDGRHALELIRTRSAEIDLAVIDIAMPGPGGRELAARLRERRPGLPLLLMSGHPNGDAQGRSAEVPFLQKPFAPEELLARIDGLLER